MGSIICGILAATGFLLLTLIVQGIRRILQRYVFGGLIPENCLKSMEICRLKSECIASWA